MASRNNKPASARQPEPVTEDHEEENHETGGELVNTGNSGPPAELMGDMEQYAGAGVSTDASDNLIPLIYLLQTNSPQVNKHHEAYIRNAEGSDIWLRNAPEGYELVKGEEGLLFQPCFFSKEWVEWASIRGEGIKGRHPWNNRTQFGQPTDAVLTDVKDEQGNVRKRWKMPSGNFVVETRYHAGWAYVRDRVLGYTIPFSSTGLTVSKNWTGQLNAERLPNGKPAPSFIALYRLRPVLRRKGTHAWFQYTVERERYFLTAEEKERGIQLWQAFDSGTKQIAEETEEFDVRGTVPEMAGAGEDVAA